MSKTIFVNVNEEGQPYDLHENLADALNLLEQFPNDTIAIAFDDSPAGPCRTPTW